MSDHDRDTCSILNSRLGYIIDRKFITGNKIFKFQPTLLEDALGYSQLRFWGRRNSEFWAARGIRVCAVPNRYICYNIISRKGMCVLKILVTFLYRNLSSLYFKLCVYMMVIIWGNVFINHNCLICLVLLQYKWSGKGVMQRTQLFLGIIGIVFLSAAVRCEKNGFPSLTDNFHFNNFYTIHVSFVVGNKGSSHCQFRSRRTSFSLCRSTCLHVHRFPAHNHSCLW